MSRAEEAARKAYFDGPYYGGRSAQRLFIEGYLQAEKDLELTPDDIRNIDLIITDCMNDMKPPRNDFWEEVLKRFNKGRK